MWVIGTKETEWAIAGSVPAFIWAYRYAYKVRELAMDIY